MDEHIPFLNGMMDLKSTLVPHKTNLKKLRIGGEGDGGYVIGEIPHINYDALYSYGSDDNIKFEKSFYEKYKVESFVYDHTIDGITNKPDYIHFFKEGVASTKQPNLDTIDNHIIKNGHQNCSNLFMQMDIEGHEWMDTVGTSYYLKNFAQLNIEFHFTYNIPFNYYFKTFSKINENFICTHVHGNNCPLQPWFDGNFPQFIEATYIRKDLIESSEIESSKLPLEGLDCANDTHRPDLTLDWWLQKYTQY
jgi:hypothetical protein